MDWHCPEYEELTIEEKLLVAKEMKEWFKENIKDEEIVPTFIFKVAESRIIERLKQNDKRNRKSGASRTDSK